MNVGARLPHSLRHQRGSVLIVALIFAVIIGISLAGYLRLANSTLHQATRSYYSTSAVNVAEIGLERALSCFNLTPSLGLATAWSGWTTSGTGPTDTASNTFALASDLVGPGASAAVSVYVTGYTGAVTTPPPVVVVKATITPPNGPALSKYVEIQLRRRSLFSWGVVAISKAELLSNVKVNSYDSSIGPYNPLSPGDHGSVAVASKEDDALKLDSNAQIYGTAHTGGENIDLVTALSNARIYNSTSPASPAVDEDQIGKDFRFNPPPIVVPSAGAYLNTITGNVSSTTTFPSAAVGTVQHTDGTYYYQFASGKSINVSSSTVVTIDNAKVVIFMVNNQATVFDSNSSLVLSGANPSLKIYTNGDFSALSGSPFINLNVPPAPGGNPANFMIYGTNTSTNGQRIFLDSNIKFYGCVYAPKAKFEANSNTEVFGAVVANEVKLDSNAMVHYDQNLANLNSGKPFGISRWKELELSTERAVYNAFLP